MTITSDWLGMESAPSDRVILAINAAGEEAEIFRKKTHPKIDVWFWCKYVDTSDPNWEKSECFYPVGWKEKGSV